MQNAENVGRVLLLTWLTILTFCLSGCVSPVDFLQPRTILEIAYINAPTQVPAGQQLHIEVGIQYSTTKPTTIMVQVYEHAGPLLAHETRVLEGSGVATFSFFLRAPSVPRPWQLNVHLFRLNRDWTQVEIKSTVVNVVGVQEILEIAGVVGPATQIRVNQVFTLEVIVRYTLSDVTGVMVQIYEHAGPLLASQRRSLSGQGTATFQFSLTAPSIPRQWQLNAHLFRWDVPSSTWIQIEIKSVVLMVL